MSSNAITPQSPLMQPLAWQGQEYFTSQYFHQQYLTNSAHKGKYQRLDSFMRLLRSIPAYALYEEQGAIIEIRWPALKQEEPHLCVSFQPLFQAAGWNPLTLLNSTAQLALTHHLDDALSQQVSVAANTTVARQMGRKAGTFLPAETAARTLEAYMHIGRLLQTPEYIVQQEAAKQIEITTGVNLRPLLRAAPAQDNIAIDDKMLEPADLAKEFGMPSGYAVNRALEQIGWHIKRIGGGWEPTPLGTPHAAQHAWTADHGHKSGFNIKWNVEAVRQAFRAHGAIASA